MPCYVFAVRSQHKFDRLYVIAQADLMNAFKYAFQSRTRPLEELITERLTQWNDPLKSTTSNTRFNFT